MRLRDYFTIFPQIAKWCHGRARSSHDRFLQLAHQEPVLERQDGEQRAEHEMRDVPREVHLVQAHGQNAARHDHAERDQGVAYHATRNWNGVGARCIE